MIKSKISGVGYYVPENIVKNSDIEEMMDTSDQWIRERTGIEERRWVNDDKLSTSLMGTYASEAAIKDAGIDKNDIDFIIFSTLSPDYYFPGSGVLLQRNLKINLTCIITIKYIFKKQNNNTNCNKYVSKIKCWPVKIIYKNVYKVYYSSKIYSINCIAYSTT